MEGKILMLKYNKKIKDKYRHFDILLDNKEVCKDADIVPIHTTDGRLLKIEIMRDGTILIGWFVDHFKAVKSEFSNAYSFRVIEGPF